MAREKRTNGESIQKSIIERQSRRNSCPCAFVRLGIREINPRLIVHAWKYRSSTFNRKNKKITDVHGQLLKQPVQKLKDMQSAEFTMVRE